MFPSVLDPKFPLLALFDPMLFPNVFDCDPAFAPLLLPLKLSDPPPLASPKLLLAELVLDPPSPPVVELELEVEPLRPLLTDVEPDELVFMLTLLLLLDELEKLIDGPLLNRGGHWGC